MSRINESQKVTDARPQPAAILSGVFALLKLLCAIAFVLIAAFFGISSCVSDLNSALLLVGLGQEEAESKISIRELDPTNQNDVRLAQALIGMASAGGLDTNNIRAVIAETPAVNAATIGQSRFILCRGLTRLLDYQLDAVMAHEVAHDSLSHCATAERRSGRIKSIVRAIGTLFGADSGAKGTASDWVAGAILPSYSREQEREADVLAVQILMRAGYEQDARSVMCNTLKWLEDVEGADAGGFLSTHPSMDDRIEHIKESIR